VEKWGEDKVAKAKGEIKVEERDNGGIIN